MNNTNLLKTGFVNERFRYYEKLVAELTMMSDMFMRNVLNILECAEYVLRVITENDDLELTEVVVQKDYKNLQGRSADLCLGNGDFVCNFCLCFSFKESHFDNIIFSIWKMFHCFF